MSETKKPSALDALRQFGDQADILANDDARHVLAAYAHQSPGALSNFEKLHLLRRDETGELQLTDDSKGLALDFGLESGTALTLSGGGYRSMLFQTGVLWRFNEAGMLPQLSAISAVSGSSISAAVLGLHWSRLDFDARGVARRFTDQVVTPLLALASETIDIAPAALSMIGAGSGALVGALQKKLFHGALLGELPESPIFTFCAADLMSGLPWTFDRNGMGQMRDCRWSPAPEIAIAVTASLSVPSFASVRLKLPKLSKEQGPKEVALADGMLVDRFGLEPVWDRFRTIYVSDGSPLPRPEEKVGDLFFQGVARALDLMDGQGRRIWKRLLISSFQRGDRHGAYWGIESDVGSSGLDDPLAFPQEARDTLVHIPMRYSKLESQVQRQLINWGFVVADTMLRRHGDGTVQRPASLPYADVTLSD